MLELRRIKNRLNVVRPLIEGGHLEAEGELRAWLALQEQLP
jgi:hypothetical protein